MPARAGLGQVIAAGRLRPEREITSEFSGQYASEGIVVSERSVFTSRA